MNNIYSSYICEENKKYTGNNEINTEENIVNSTENLNKKTRLNYNVVYRTFKLNNKKIAYLLSATLLFSSFTAPKIYAQELKNEIGHTSQEIKNEIGYTSQGIKNAIDHTSHGIDDEAEYKYNIKNETESGQSQEAGGVYLQNIKDKSEYTDDVKSATTQEKNIRLIVELEKDSIIEEAINRDIEYSQLGEAFIDDKKEELKIDQDLLLSEIKDSGIEADTSQSRHYDTIFNGFTIDISSEKSGEIQKIENLPGVKNVYVSQEFQRPHLKSSNKIIGSSYAWNTLGYKGEGTVIAVIDSGIDYTHKAFRLDDPQKAAYSKESIETAIRQNRLKGSYYSDKIPYGYNYYDYNKNLFDSYGIMHGMHVSGIAGANDKEENIYGVAPNAQILALKVFSDDIKYPSTFTDIWLKALDDAIALKADVVNLSLGSAAGFSIEGRDYPESEVINKARKAGIVISISAGNDGTITAGNPYNIKPLKQNYDTAVVASPALDEASIAVASMENSKKQLNIIKFKDEYQAHLSETVDLHKGENAPEIISKNIYDLKNFTDAQLDPDKTADNIKGKFAMLELDRNLDSSFSDKLKNIVKYNPAGIILYNNKNTGEQLTGVPSLPDEAKKITVLRIKRSTYDKIKKAYDKNNDLKIDVYTKTQSVENINSGTLSSFSSWGPTPDLRIKPEITAPGGSIYSTTEDQKYKNMSGTSMASPQVAGAAAIVKQYIKQNNIATNDEYGSSEFVKLLLMNTAVPLKEYDLVDDVPYFVRQQGSGVLNIENALKTKVVVRVRGTNDDNADGKLELREIHSKQFSARLTLENFGDAAKTYTISSEALYEPVEDGYRTQTSALIKSKQSQVRKKITVDAYSTLDEEFVMDYSDAQELEENNFIEGFITLEDSDGISNLSIPFLGFYGDWAQQKAIDAFQLPEKGQDKRQVQFNVGQKADTPSSMFGTKMMLKLPVYKGILYFSPGSVYYPEAGVRIAPLRNMEDIEYSIINEDTNETLRVLGMSKSVRKLNRLNVNSSFIKMPDSYWDGKINGMPASDDINYIYQIKAKLNNNGIGGDGEQIYRYPIRIDTSKPVVNNINITGTQGNTEGMKDVSFKVYEKGIGIEKIYLQSVRYLKGDNGQLMPRYGRAFAIIFTDEPVKDNKQLIKVEDGKLFIPESQVPDSPDKRGEIYVYSNNFRNSEIEIHCPYFVDSAKLLISAQDYLSNENGIITDTGAVKEYNILRFVNFFDYIENYKANVYINGNHLVDRDTYTTNEEKAVIKIVLPDNKSHLSRLSLKSNNVMYDIIKDDKPDMKNIKKYKFRYNSDDNSVEFTIEQMDAGYDIATAFKSGSMPDLKETGNEDESGKDNGENKNNNPENRQENGAEKPPATPSNAGNKNHSGYTKDAGAKNNKNSYATPSDASKDEKEDLLIIETDESDIKNDINNTKKGYPAVFLNTPGLLDILNASSVREGKLKVAGFIGYINEDDVIEDVNIKLVDNDGNTIGDIINIKGSDLYRKKINLRSSGKTLYDGYGYPFETEINVEDFNVDIRVEVITAGKKTASIVRRLFYDRLNPLVDYQVYDRELSSENVRIKVRARDNSIKLRLYRGDSLIGMDDKTGLSYRKAADGVTTEIIRDIKVPLNKGQNSISISSVDIAGNKTQKTIYIYRSN
ncbi:S8 family serine peptidase [Johnsonella ignava]|uniref:S8 family serine peptidase n=1 Tax=Johnsonella ignava TaxID=43995 RepID=UPI0023F24FDA|nr:S8 family serine peptidase [Johnsonella ignava]